MKSKITLALLILILAGSFFFVLFKLQAKNKTNPSDITQTNKAPDKQSESPEIISTIPDPLDETIIPASQVIEITFNKSLQNVPEFKVRIEPKIDFKVELSPDRKTAKITTSKPFNLGAEYTLSIGPDTKFDGAGEWGQNKSFHFRTVPYRGV